MWEFEDTRPRQSGGCDLVYGALHPLAGPLDGITGNGPVVDEAATFRGVHPEKLEVRSACTVQRVDQVSELMGVAVEDHRASVREHVCHDVDEFRAFGELDRAAG